jgi:hypothetical protein
MKKVVLALAVLPVIGCFKGPVAEPTNAPPEPTSPVNSLKLTEVSFNRREANLLGPVLSPDFVFYFDPRDVGQNPPGSQYVIPESWSYAEFREAVKNMYEQAYSISLSISTAHVGEPGSSETVYRIENVSISLLVMISELNGFLADGGYCNFEFERYETEESKEYWRLTAWWDRTSEHMDAYVYTTPTSVGKVLAIYR